MEKLSEITSSNHKVFNMETTENLTTQQKTTYFNISILCINIVILLHIVQKLSSTVTKTAKHVHSIFINY